MIQLNFAAFPQAAVSVPEMPALPAEPSEDVSRGHFFAHMDAILNRDVQSEDAAEEEPSRKDAGRPETDPLAMMLGASQPPVAQNEPDKTLSADSSSVKTLPVDAPDGSVGSVGTADVKGSPDGQTVAGSVQFSIPTAAANISTPLSESGQESADLSEAMDAGSVLGADGIENAAGTASEQILNPNEKQQGISIPIPGSTALDAEGAKITSEPKASLTEAVAAAKETLPEKAETAQIAKALDQSATRQVEAGLAAKTTDGAAEASDDSMKLTAADKPVVAVRTEAVAQPAAENAGGNNSHSERQNAQAEQMVLRTGQQNRADSTQASVKPEFSLTEASQTATVVATTSHITVNDTNLVADAPRPQAAAAQQPDFVSQLAEKIQVQVRDGNNEIRIQLHPENLGHLEIKAESTVSGVVARIVAESNTVKNYLESNLHILQQSLQDQGLKIDRIQVSVQDNGSSASFSGFAAQSGYAGSGSQNKGNGRSSESLGYGDMTPTEESGADAAALAMMNPNTRFYTVA